MAGNQSDAPTATGTDVNAALSEQLQLSRSVHDLAIQQHRAGAGAAGDAGHKVHPGQTSAVSESKQSAPESDFDKFKAVTAEGVENIPRGIWHALHNGTGLAENAALSVGLGVAAKLVLPETGAAGKLFALGLGAYFAEQTAVPVYTAYKNGFNARTMGDIHAAGGQLGDALGGLAINAPIGIFGYKLGAGIGSGIMAKSGAGVETAPGKLEGRVEVNDKVEGQAPTDAQAKGPELPERYRPIQEEFSGTKIPGISRQFMENLAVDENGQYYGSGLHYPDIMADPEMAAYIKGHNDVTMASIDKAIYAQELANQAKASSYKLPPDWESSRPPQHAIDVTDGGDGKMRVGSKTYSLTDDGAPNRKLVMSDDLHPGRATTLIAEPKDFEMQQVIAGKAGGADRLAVVGSQHGASVLHVYDAAGKLVNSVPLEGYGTLHDVRQGASASEIKFLYDTPISHPQVLTVDLAEGKTSLSSLSKDVFNTADYTTEKVLVPWTDIKGNAQISPVFVSRPKILPTDGKGLSMFKIYGGFDVGPQYVGYSPSTASWLMRGGVAVDPVLPGDGGLGKGNFEEGLGAGIENTDRALTAIIQKMHDMGYSSPELTGIYGRSNGGMVVNHYLNQRPEMIGAAVTESGVNSLFDSPVINVDTGQYWTPEFGDPNNPVDVSWMSKLDVLNNIPKQKTLPPTLVEIGSLDGVVNVGNGITYHDIRQGLGNGESRLFTRIGEGHDPVNLNLALQTAFLWHRLSAVRA